MLFGAMVTYFMDVPSHRYNSKDQKLQFNSRQ